MNTNGNYREISQFIAVGLKDANTGGLAEDFTVNFNNPQITMVNSDIPTTLEPMYLVLDWAYDNVSDYLKNNTLEVSAATAIFRSASSATAFSTKKIILPDNTYGGAALAFALQSKLNTEVQWRRTDTSAYTMNWVVQYFGVDNSFAIGYGNDYQAVAAGSTTETAVTVKYRETGEYDATTLWGFDPAETSIVLARKSPVTATGTSFTFTDDSANLPNIADLKIYNIVRLHSSMAKRFLEKRGSKLSNTDILLEIPIPNNYNNGQQIILDYTGANATLKQSINPNFDNVSFSLRDINGNIIKLQAGSDFRFSFKVTRFIEQETKEDRLYNINNYQKIGGI
jgi:hypothetical protein